MTDRKTYCVTSVKSIGCTFLDWSILYLSGQNKVFKVDTLEWHDISANPLQSGAVSNAHGHRKNHYSGWQRNKDVVQSIHNNTTSGLISLYPIALHIDDCCRDLQLNILDLQQPSSMQQILAYQKQDYTNMLEWIAQDQQIPVIYVAFDTTVKGYLWSFRALDRMMTSSKKTTDINELEQEVQDVFFRASQQHWIDLGLTEIWDIRERMALDMRPYDNHWSDDLLLAHDHYWVHCQDLWFDTESTVRKIMAWLNLDIIEENVKRWLPIMRSWQQIHNNNLRFPRHLPKILKSIVHGYKHDISQLTFKQEVIIQHCLIYQHGLNLKTWKLDKFPACASQLHLLLEPNFHPLH